MALGASPNNKGLISNPEVILNRITTIGAIAAYVVILQLVYVFVISPVFSYLGYTARALPLEVVLVASVLAILPAMWLPLRLRRPSQIVYWALYLVAYIPSVIVPFYAMELPLSELIWYATVLFVALGMFGLIYRLPLLRIRRPEVRGRPFWGLIGIFSVGAVGMVIWSFGVPTSLPGLTAIYEVREGYRADLQAGGRLAALAITWLVSIIGPLLIAVGLVWRRWGAAIIGLAVELLAFAITGYKSALLAPAAIVAVYLLIRYGSRVLGSIFSVGALILVSASVVIDAMSNQIVLTSWLVRRLLITPGLVAGRFFEYFSENGFAHLGHSILEGIIQPPYSLSPPELIGLAYDGRIYSANANFWADGFANFGVLGMVLATLVVASVAYLIDSISSRVTLPNRQVVTLILIQPAITLSNSAAITSLVSHGLLIIVLIVLFAPRNYVLRHPGYAPRSGPPQLASGEWLGAERTE